MSKANYKTLKISPDLHKIIKDYCKEEGLIMNVWVEKQLKKNILKQNGKME